MENKEILKDEEFLASTEDRAALDQTMFPAMESFEISGKVLPPNNDISLVRSSFCWWQKTREVHRKSGFAP